MLWLLIPLGLIGVVVSGVLTSRHTGGSPELWGASPRGIGPRLVPKWVSWLNIVGWAAIVIGVVSLFVD